MKKTFFFTVLSICLIKSAYAQVSGRFVAANELPVPFANVLLINASDSVLIGGSTTDESGIFIIEFNKTGTYYVKFTGIGYAPWTSAVFELTTTNPKKNIGTQTVLEDVKQLGELTIKGQKPLFQQEIDRTVVNVESSVLSKGSSALQVLERSPGVYVDRRNNNIALNGKSSVMVMLNGKLMRLPMAQLTAMLNSMNADDIEKIELITTPPAKYDADGSAGMINIILKKREDVGTTGSGSITAGYGYKEKGAGSISFAHNTGKINAYGSYSFLHDNGRDGWDATGGQNMPAFGGELTVDAGSQTTAISNGQNSSVGLDWNLGKTTAGASINFSGNKAQREMSNYGAYQLVHSDSLLLLKAKINSQSRWTNVLSSIYIEQKLREGEKLNVDIDYLINDSKNPNEGYTAYFDKNGNEAVPAGKFFSNRQKGVSGSTIHVGVLKMDYARQLNQKLKLETGIKGTLTKSSSLSTIENFIDGEWVGSSRYTNDIDMKETIGAAYASFNIAASPKLNIMAGIRYEYSHTYADADKPENKIDRRLGKLFPSLFLSRKLNDQSELQFSYTKRINRPSFNDLSSYLLYIDPMSVATGNPSLRPTITTNLKAGYNFKGLSFSLLGSREKNPIVLYQLAASPAGDVMYNSPQNMAYQNSLMFQANLPIPVAKWWNISMGINGGLRQFKLDHTIEKLKKTYPTWSVNGSQTFTLPQNISFELSGFYNGVQYEGSKKIDGFGMLNAGVKMDLKNNWGSFQMSVTDLFKSMRVSGYFGTLTEEAFSLYAHFIYRAESARYRTVRLTYSKSFGNVKIKSERKQGNSVKDEQDRIRKN